MISRTGVSFGEEGSPGDLFYPQARVFSDFLLSRTGDAAVLGDIAEAVAAGGSFETWLETSEAGRKLGGSMQGLDAAWRTWLVDRYGSPQLK